MDAITIIYRDLDDGTYAAYEEGTDPTAADIGCSPDEAIGAFVRESLLLPGRLPIIIKDVSRWASPARFIRFEYDLQYTGGDYSKVGNFAYVPLSLVREVGEEVAFEQHTGHNRVHIIHYSSDQLYDENSMET